MLPKKVGDTDGFCGQEMPGSANRAAGVFRWQEVACSPECGAIYLQKINESRGIVNPQKKTKRKKCAEPVIEQVVVNAELIGEKPVEEE